MFVQGQAVGHRWLIGDWVLSDSVKTAVGTWVRTHRTWIWIWMGASVAFIALVVVMLLVSAGLFGWPATRTKIVLFATSSGMAGLAAVIAALIAAVNISRQIGQARQAEIRQNWWTNFKWAADKAAPSGEAARALPISASISTMNSLQKGTDDPLQKAACGTIVDLLAKLSESQSTSGNSDPGRFQALREYIAASKDTPAASVGAVRAIYKRDLLNQLEHIAVRRSFGYAEDVALPSKKKRHAPQFQVGSGMVDADIRNKNKRVLVKVRWWDSVPSAATLERRIQVVAARISQADSSASILIIVPFDLPDGVSSDPSRGVRIVTWIESGGYTMLENAIDQLDKPVRPPRLRRG